MSSTVEVLSTQHQDVLTQLAAVESELANGQSCDLAGFAAFLHGDVMQHFLVEEEALFPILARYIGEDHGPLAVMHHEHAAFRDLLAALRAAVAAHDLPQQRTHALALIDLLRGHIAKEDQILFPMAMRMLNPAEQQEVDSRAAALEASPAPAGA